MRTSHNGRAAKLECAEEIRFIHLSSRAPSDVRHPNFGRAIKFSPEEFCASAQERSREMQATN